ncbi:MAG: NAD-dependent epimerase/dehydratase family protein, partial [bacterium]|nr:NAD-dependent epimerase/dehydratase family protein [bacterium]
MTKRKILLTGASGFIGNALTESLLQKGFHVTGFIRKPSSNRAGLNPMVEWVQWDGKSFAGCESSFADLYGVINLAGEPVAPGRWTDSKKEKIISSRIHTGQILAEALKKTNTKPSVFIQASAIGFYGPGGDEELDESSAGGTGFLAEVVKKWEMSTQELDEMGIRRCIIRIGLVLGNDGGAFPRMSLPFRLFAGGPI